MTSNFPTLPAGWIQKTVGEISKIQSGFPVNKKNEIENGYVHLRTHNISTSGKLNFDYLVKVENSLIKANCSTLKKDDILFNNTNSTELVGKTALVDQDYPYAFSNHLTKIEIDQKIALPSFFVYYFMDLFTKGYFVSICNKWIGQSGVNTTMLKEITVPLPPINEQKRLVFLLDTLFAKIDRSIELLNENIAAADALIPSALNTVFAVDIIQDWEKYQFDKISKFIDYRGKTPTKTEDGTVLITAKNVRFGYLSDEPKEYIADADYEGWMTRGIPNKGDVIFTTEAPLGNVAILNTNEKRAFAQRIVTFQPISDVYDSNFLYWYMLSPIFQKELYDSATGTTVKGIKTSILKKFKIPLPSLDIQTQTVTYLDSVRDRALRLKVAQNTKKSQLIALKASILDRAFKGEL